MWTIHYAVFSPFLSVIQTKAVFGLGFRRSNQWNKPLLSSRYCGSIRMIVKPPQKGRYVHKRCNIAPFPVSIPSMSRDARYLVLYRVLCTPLLCTNSGWVFFCGYCQCCPFFIFVTFVIQLYKGLLVVPFLFRLSLMWNLCGIFK